MRRSRPRVLLAVFFGLALVAAACGDSNGGGDATPAPTTAAAPATTAAGDDTPATTAAPADTAAPATTAAPPPAKSGGELVVAVSSDANNWGTDIGAWSPIAGLTISRAICITLVDLTDTGEVVPFAAESFTFNDENTELTLKLPPGLLFSDGTPLDAAAMKYNFDTVLKSEGSRRARTMGLDTITMNVVDDTTVTYVFETPNPPFPHLMLGQGTCPASPSHILDHGEWRTDPVFAGPFMFESWTPGSELVLVRNPNYWRTDENGEQLPYLDKITFKVIGDESTRLAALQSGDVDVIVSQSFQTIQTLLGDDSFNEEVWVGGLAAGAVINGVRPPTDDVRVRQAIAYSIDQNQFIIAQGGEAIARPHTQFSSEESVWFSQTIADAYPTQDFDMAGALADDYINDPARSDGKSVGSPISIEYVYRAGSKPEIALLLQQFLAGVNIEMEIQEIDPTAFGGIITGPEDWSMAAVGLGSDRDPGSFVPAIFDPRGLNLPRWTAPDAERLIDTIKQSPIFDERYDAYEQFGQMLIDLTPMVLFGSQVDAAAWQPDVQGIVLQGFAIIDWAQVYLGG